VASLTEERSAAPSTGLPPWGSLPQAASSLLKDAPIVLGGLAIFYGLLALAHYWAGPVNTQPDIDLSPTALPKYALFSVARILVAYVLSFFFTIAYAYVAAHNARAERILIPLLDTLQSIPVLSFLPGVMLAMVALFPTKQLGVELGSVLLILTGQVWNMIFSVYSSIKSIPREMLEAAQIYRLSWWQRLIQLELPYSSIGLVWNSMMSVAGAWFFLMACEMFTLGNRDLRLPGLGSYLQTASNAGNTRAIVWGLIVMIAVIVLIDQFIWRPMIAWSEKFKMEQVEATQTPHSWMLNFLRRSRVVSSLMNVSILPARERLTLRFAQGEPRRPARLSSGLRFWLTRILLLALLAVLTFAAVKMIVTLAGLSSGELARIFRGAGATFLRVELTLLLAGLWAVPVGILVGLHPKLAAFTQPIAQIAASVPATALFPIVMLVLIRIGGGLGVGSVVLLLLGTQWYILFNVIAGATAIPTDLKEVSQIFRMGRLERWRTLFLPAVFPYLITGFVTASGGAWNASIVAEYFRFQGKTISTTGLGAVISSATDSGNSRLLLGATVMMAAMVVTFNRLVWRRLYSLAATRFKLET